MRRMRRARRHLLWLGPVLGVATVLGGAWWGWLPGKVRSHAERELARRTGLGVRIEDVDMSLRGAVLEDVRLGGAGAAITVALDEVGVRIGFWKALLGETVVEYVQVRGGRVAVDLSRPELAMTVARLRGGGASGVAHAGAGEEVELDVDEPRPSVEVRDLALSVRDRHGVLGEAEGVSVRLDRGVTRFACETLALGAREGDRFALEGAFVAFDRASEGGLRLVSLVSDRGEVRWAPPDPQSGRATSDEGTPAPLPVRLREALGAVTSSGESQDGRTDAEDASTPGLFARLSPDVRVDLGDLTFHGRAPDGTATTIRFTELLLGRADDGRLHTVGVGDGGENGSARWNLFVDPASARAEGDLRFDALPMGFVAPLVPFVPLHATSDGKLSADLRLRMTQASTVEIEGRISVENAALSSPRIADRPVAGFTASLEGSGVWHPAERRLVWNSGHIRSGDADLRLSGELAITDEAYRIRFEGTLPPTDCQAVIDAIPRDVLGPVASFRLAGSIGGSAVVRLDSRRLADTEVDIQVADGCEFIAVPVMAEIYRFDHPFAHQVIEPDGTVFTMTTGPGTSNWTPFGSIHRNVVTAILSHEDGSFFSHSGFAPWAIREALIRNLEAGAFRWGASTISMQLTKNLFLRREKTLVRKVQEVFLTWWLERALEKHRILELYLNVIEYGPGIYGIRNATRHYFGREPSDVSPAEAAFLAHVLPAPKRYAGMYEVGAPSESTLSRMAQFLRHMHARGRIGAETLAYGLDELPSFRFHREGAPPPPPRVLPGDPPPESFDESGDRGEPAEDDAWAVSDEEG